MYTLLIWGQSINVITVPAHMEVSSQSLCIAGAMTAS